MTKFEIPPPDDIGVEWIEIITLVNVEPTFIAGLKLLNGEKPKFMTMTTWYCDYCGSWVSLDKLYCTQCGAPRCE